MSKSHNTLRNVVGANAPPPSLHPACSATPRTQLIRELLDSRIAKNEREWCAAHEIEDMLAFIREQVELWDNDGDSGFPLYEHGKRILARYPSPNTGTHRREAAAGDDQMQTRADSAASRSVQ